MENKTNNEVFNWKLVAQFDHNYYGIYQPYNNTHKNICNLFFNPGNETKELQHENAELIISAVNSCKQINPSNPINAANAYGEVLEALKCLLQLAETWGNGVQYPTILNAKAAIEKATKR